MQRHSNRPAAGTIHDIAVARAFTAATFILLAIAVACWPRHAAAQNIPASASYSCDFSNGYCDLGEQSKLGDAPPDTARRSSLVSTSRGMSLQLHTEPGDDQVHGSGTWERDDVGKAPDPSYCNEGQEEWWAVSVMFPSDYVYPPGPESGVVLDWHHNSSSGLPNLSIDTMPNGLGMRVRGQGGDTLNGGQYTSWFNDPYNGGTNDVTRNVWYDFVFHIKWSSTSAGFSEAWLNGKKIHTYSGATLYTGISCYFKLANYHEPFGKASSIIFNRLVRGTSAADVALGPLEGVGTTPTASSSSGGSSSGGSTGGSTTPSTGGSGQLAASATMDSSAYTIAAGSSVTFTARILGNGATPTGSIAFKSDGAAIAGCGSVMLANGSAACSTSSLPGGTHAITGLYSGDSSYGAALAGPIPETVTGSGASATVSLPSSFGMDSSSYTSSAGQSVTFTATIPGAGGTVGFSDNGAAIAGCGAVTVSGGGTATCTTASLASGAHAITGLYSGNGGYPAGVAGPITQTVLAVTTPSTPTAFGTAFNVQGLWWGASDASQSGWGVNLVQQGDQLFATWFTYDQGGNGMWLVMPASTRTGDNAYTGTLFRTTGPALASTFDPTQVRVSAVGTATFSFTDPNNGTFTASVNGTTISKPITRQVFGTLPSCSEGSPASSNYQDLWWREGGIESGWGLNITHQGDVLFITWFTYDANGNPMWLVGSNLNKVGDGTYVGTLYRTTGPSFDSATWDPSRVGVAAVGTATLAFTDGTHGTFTTAVDGVTISKPIVREVFATPATTCH